MAELTLNFEVRCVKCKRPLTVDAVTEGSMPRVPIIHIIPCSHCVEGSDDRVAEQVEEQVKERLDELRKCLVKVLEDV